MSRLPSGWTNLELADAVVSDAPIIYGILQPGPNVEGGVPYVRPTEVQNGTIVVDELRRTTSDIAERYRRSTLDVGDLILSIVGTIGKVAVVPLELRGGNITQSSCRIRPEQRICMRDWMKFFLISPLAATYYNESRLGTAVPRLNLEDVRQFVLPLPPLAEQKRIVSKLDGLTAKSTRASTELARIETLVSRFKQAVLSKAFSGELTREWRGERQDISEWRTSSVGSECDIRLGKMLDKAKNKGEPTRYLRNVNVRWGAFDLSDLLLMNMTSDERVKLDIRDGDVLLCEGGEPGRCAVWKYGPTDISFQKALMRIRPKSQLLSSFFFHFMRWASESNLLSRHFTGTTIKHLPQAALSKVPLIVAPLEEQHEIVRRIESAFDKIDRLAAGAGRALNLLGKLDDAILAKAFSGELVPQDENDEPAEKLLERIRAERAAAPKEKSKRIRRETTMPTAREFLNKKLENWPVEGVSFQDLRLEFGGSYEDLKEAVFASLSDEKSALHQVFDEQASMMTIRKRA